jgi:predicted phosphodiesterase
VRLAVLDDIHGNLSALDAVLGEVRGARADRIVVGGDVFPGPEAQAALRTLMACGIPVDFIYGNGEVAILDELAGRTPQLPEAFRPSVRWNAEQLDSTEQAFIRRWPMTIRMNVPSIGDVLFCHATPRDENEIFTRLTPEERLIPIFDSVNAALVVCGHTHIVMDRRIGRVRVVNPGSVGMPFGPPGADWMILGPDVEMRHTDYDLGRAAERIRASGYPGAEEFAAKHVLLPPSADRMLEAYAAHELK